MGKGASAAIVIVAVLGVGSLFGGGASDASGNGSGAKDACQSWAKDQLKAPSTADFSNVDTTGPDSGPWVITGDVDAENGFGAKIRTGWICNVRLIGDTYRGSASLLEL